MTRGGGKREAATRARSIVFVVGLLLVASCSTASEPTGGPFEPQTWQRSSIECNGQRVDPEDDLASSVNEGSAGTSFCLSQGVYRLTEPLTPADGQALISEGGAVLDGGSGETDGISADASGVTVRGLEIRNFRVGIRAGRQWTILDNDIHSNTQEGVRLKGGDVLRNNFVHDNGLGGVFGAGTNLLVVNNEIAHNQLIKGIRCSSKFVLTTGLIVRGNNVHHNNCPALWADINNVSPLFERNTSVDNRGPGIDCEISYGCIIRYNTVHGNNKGILAASSPNVQIYGNKIFDNDEFAISVLQQGNDEGIRTDHPSPLGPHVVTNNYVHDNVIATAGGYTGVVKVGNVDDTIFSPAANNRFERNRYIVESPGELFRWTNESHTWASWQGLGHDQSGIFTNCDGSLPSIQDIGEASPC